MSLPQTITKLSLCRGTLQNHVSLLEDTTSILLLNLIGAQREMTCLPFVPWPCFVHSILETSRRESYMHGVLNEAYLQKPF